MADDNETFLDKIYEEIVNTKYDWNLSEEVLELYKNVYDPLRYVFHIMQMESMYLASMAPTSSITNVFIFMGMDHMRRVQRIAQRVKMLDIIYPSLGFGKEARKIFEESPLFQLTREVLEKMLATYDVGESLVAFNLAVKFVLDELALQHLTQQFSKMGDEMIRHIHMSFYNDTLRHRHQAQELFKYAFSKEPSLKDVIKPWLKDWQEMAFKATEGFRDVLKGEYDNTIKQIKKAHSEYLGGIGL